MNQFPLSNYINPSFWFLEWPSQTSVSTQPLSGVWSGLVDVGASDGRRQAEVSGLMKQKRHDWSGVWLSPVSNAAVFDCPEAEAEGEPFDLRIILPTRLACEVNGFNGGLLTGVLSVYHFYIDYYGTKWPSDCSPEVVREDGSLYIDVDTAWSPPSEAVLEALSARCGGTVEHYYSEAGCDYCGYRRYDAGALTESIDDSLEYDGEEDEYGYCEVSGPSWLTGNVPHYGG